MTKSLPCLSRQFPQHPHRIPGTVRRDIDMIMEEPTNDIRAGTMILEPVGDGSDQPDSIQTRVDGQRDLLAGEHGVREAVGCGESFGGHEGGSFGLLGDQLWGEGCEGEGGEWLGGCGEDVGCWV